MTEVIRSDLIRIFGSDERLHPNPKIIFGSDTETHPYPYPKSDIRNPIRKIRSESSLTSNTYTCVYLPIQIHSVISPPSPSPPLHIHIHIYILIPIQVHVPVNNTLRNELKRVGRGRSACSMFVVCKYLHLLQVH
jgi:hypothetical protein